MVQPGARSRIVLSIIWLLLGAAMIGVAIWLGWTGWSVLLSGHPLLPLLTIVCVVVGLVAVLWAGGSLILGGRLDLDGDSVIPRRRTPAQMQQRARLRLILAIPALVLSALLVAVVAYARPLAATPVAVAALVPDDQVRIADRITWYEMIPIREDRAGNEILPTTGSDLRAGRTGGRPGVRPPVTAAGRGRLPRGRTEGAAGVLHPRPGPSRVRACRTSGHRLLGTGRSLTRRHHGRRRRGRRTSR